MKKIGSFVIIVIIFSFIILISINSIFAEVRINEIELNPSGSDSGHEWVELYSDNLINLNNWKLVNHDNKNKILNQNFQGYMIINLEGQWLDNENESLNLYNGNGVLISFTPILKDSSNDDKSWNYCGTNSWSFASSSPETVNNCPGVQNNKQNNSINNSLTINIEWDNDKIKNGKSFDINVNANNLNDKEYDIKVYIYETDENKPISQIYDKNEWSSSKNYIKDFLKGPGNKNKSIELRIRESDRDFSGNAKIGIRIKEKDSSSFKEIIKDIDILKASAEDIEKAKNIIINNSPQTTIENKQEVIETNAITSNVIHLGKSSSGNIVLKKKIVYESTNEKIKKYSIYAFIVLIMVILILLVFKEI